METEDIYILYGSATGNAESIASYLKEDFENFHVKGNVLLMTLNDSLNYDIINPRCIIIICSTTGNGDFPENANKWWRFYKKRSLDKDTFKSNKFILCGLGDTNYSDFCKPIKQINRRILELSGSFMMDMCLIDDATGDEEIISEWMGSVICTLQ